ncbi:uncharacterized protein LOC111568911 [Amphiprion ocellaris]|uniref:uncharacterized protein LOC111568911 n=1 Tax=Amphiprion ocellaris TaxID=80972 RepID=UPI00241104F2|nr:uncharacterized protein LOC111568911 [Amphiprion ocellaris]
MVFFIISRLLLLTLLLQETEENEEEDDSERFGEFCLRIPDDSRWTTPKPDPQPTPESTQTNQPIKQPRRKTLKLNTKRILPPDPFSFSQGFSGCRCTTENMKQPSETSEVIGSTRWFPTENCNSIEYIETLADGREVCVTPFSLLAYFNDLLSSWSKPAAGPTVETQKDKTENTQQRIDLTILPLLPGKFIVQQTHVMSTQNSKSIGFPLCRHCMTSFTISDQRIVQSLDVKMQPFPCDIHIEVNMTDGAVFCLDLINFEQDLQRWKISLPLEDDAASAPKNTAGCRCQEEAKKPLSETSPIASASIWPPSEGCSSTEFIEMLKDGREVCVAASSISAYLKTLPEKRLLGAKDPLLDPPRKPLPPLIVEPDPVSGQKMAQELPDRRGPIPSTVGNSCEVCQSPIKWTSIHPNAVQSLDMLVPSPGCPVIILIRLTDGTNFCAASSEPWFKALMEKLDI